MPHRKLIRNKGEKMPKTIPLRVSPTLAESIKAFSEKYDISQQDAIRLAIQKGLKHLSDFIEEKTEERR